MRSLHLAQSTRGLRGTILLRVGGAVLVILLVSSVVTYLQSMAIVQTQADQTGRVQARTAASQIDSLFRIGVKIATQTSALVEGVPSLTYQQLVDYERHLLAVTPAADTYDIFTFFDDKKASDPQSGIWITRKSWPHLEYASYDFHDPAQTWYSGPKSTGQLFFTEPYFDAGGSNLTLMTISAPMKRDGHFLGVSGIDIRLDNLSQVTNNLHYGTGANGSYAFLISAQGNLVTYPDPSQLVGPHGNGQTLAHVAGGRFAALAQATGEAPVPVTLPGGIAALVYHEQIPTTGATLAFVVPTAVIQAPLATLRTMAIAVTLGSLLLIALLALWLASGIARPIEQLSRAARRLAVGDTAVDGLLPGVQGGEIGDLRQSFAVMVEHQRTMSDVAERIAAGDLTVEVTPQDEKDLLGHAFASMVGNLHNVIGRVVHAATQVTSGSHQLSAATDQLGQASTQISRAIEDVARGASAQSHSATDALQQMATLSNIVGQVASGTTQQKQAVVEAERAIAQMSAALAHTSDGVTAVAQAADRAAQTATSGGAAVGQTIASIDSVRAAVLKSAEQVAVLGQRSTEVGAIVKAIDEIAEQTNLLALNAAIEAARAGEHGKGFAVVAAEVRKLAERASSETKEISARITAIQTQVSDVVAAMQAGSREVEQSATLGQQAKSALQEILGVVEETRSQATAIGGAVAQMSTSVEAVRSAAAHVAQIAGSTGAATTQMSVGAERVNQAVADIAAVSEQSAAGAQEVSASTEEQTANVEEMAAATQELAAQATSLQDAIAHFRITEHTAEDATPPQSNHRPDGTPPALAAARPQTPSRRTSNAA